MTLSPESLGVDPSAARRFSAGQHERVKALISELKRDAAVAEARVCDAFAAARLSAPEAVLVFIPAAAGVPSLFTEGGVAVRYHGAMTAGLARCLQTAHRHLKLLPPVQGCDGIRKAGEASGPRRAEPGPRKAAPEPRMRAPMPLMAVNAGLDARPHDTAARRLAELLWLPCPSLRFGSACNLSCTYCSVGSDGAPLISAEVLRGQIDGLRALGYRGIGYMGGEPTVHPAFLAVARHAAARGFERQVLVTNGMRLAEPGFAARAVEAGVRVVMVSIDAFDQKVQERLYGRRGGYAEALAGLHNVLAAPGVSVALSAVVTKHNASLFEGYMEEVAKLQRRYGKRIGVLLHALQLPAKKGPAQKEIALGLLEAAGAVVRALERARALDVTALTLSFPPCLLPGHEQRVCELYANEWLVDLEGGAAERSFMRGAASYWLACAKCPDAGHCPGVLKQYDVPEVRAAAAAPRAPARKAKSVFLCSRELGCPVNLSWTTRLHNYVRANGWTLQDAASSDFIVIVSCSTLPAMREAVASAAGYFARLYPAKKVVVSGCFVARDRVEAPNLSYVSMADLDAFDALFGPAVPLSRVSSAATVEDTQEVRAMSDARAVGNRPYNVMVSAGCLNHCTFCIGKSVFPTVRSSPLSAVLAECEEGLRSGYTNFTIGGSDVAAYGRDLGLDVTDLFEALFDQAFKDRPGLVVGFKGLEPSQFLKHLPKLKRYFKSGRIGWICLPIQSGSDSVLRHMRRDYRASEVLAAVRELRALAPGLRIDTDLLICYPTETAEDFEASLGVIGEFDHVQMLMFERHKNTSAAKLTDVFGAEEKARRRRVLAGVAQDERRSRRPECRPRVEISLPSPLGDTGFSVLMQHRGDRPAA